MGVAGMTDELGPNARRLLAMYVAAEAIPQGGKFSDGVGFIQDQEKFKAGIQTAMDKMMQAINAIRELDDYKTWDDEKIAGLLVEKIEERKHGRSPRR